MRGQSRTSRADAEAEPTLLIPSEDGSEPGTETEADSTVFRLARLLYGGILAFMALDNLRDREQMVGYAESKGAPAPETTVPAISGALLGGGVGIALWKLPRLAAIGAISFFLSVTPLMHDFWAMEGEERTQQQIHFLKNSALLGAALAFLEFARRSD